LIGYGCFRMLLDQMILTSTLTDKNMVKSVPFKIQNAWLRQFPWLCYSGSCNGGFCILLYFCQEPVLAWPVYYIADDQLYTCKGNPSGA
jgi:hypothetical protein